MKIRQGFVSNSSSSSFICVLDDSNKQLANYNHKITEEEFVYREEDLYRLDLVWDGNTFIEKHRKDILDEGGYIFSGKSDWGSLQYYREGNIYNTLDTGLGRSTSICFGEDLLEYIKELDSSEYKDTIMENLSSALKQAIQDFGLERILFLRESDEGSGGYLPKELRILTKQAIYVTEYH